MIDMDHSFLTCIYSTLKFVCAQAKRLGVTTILTFDQPLSWKAILIVSREPQSNDLKLSSDSVVFLGCIGHLMAGSGLKELLEIIYASNAVDNILTGKAISCAVRGHVLVDAAVNAMLIAMAYDSPLPGTDALDIPHDGTQGATNDPPASTAVSNGDLKEAASLFDNLMSSDKTIEEVCSADVLCRIRHMIERQKEALKQSRTACLWLQYMDMMDILRRFTKAERTGNWDLHVHTVREMLPHFLAAGRTLYGNIAYVYLSYILELESQHPDVHTSFKLGKHVIRRSDRYWAGLSSDLVIEC